jgi:formylglycine-generating enzyme required for sulfatase activity
VIQQIRMIGKVPRLTIVGQVGQTNVIWFANALVPPATWMVLTNIQVIQNPFEVDDPTVPGFASMRFYQVTVPPIDQPSDPTNRMVWIQPGTFTMGSPAAEEDRWTDEGPQTRVTISRGFWMGKYEVTQREYQTVMGRNPSFFTGDLERPAEQVTWLDATNYCAQLTAQEQAAGRLPAGHVYRLPTEAEWEYACRAGTTTRFSYGDDPGYAELADHAWYGDNSYTNAPPAGAYYESAGRFYTTQPVGQKPANPWGLHDLEGNVWEWCWDWYATTLPGGSKTDPKGPGSGSQRVLRGGSWNDSGGWYFRSASRLGAMPAGWNKYSGFRVVLAPVL